MALFDTVRLLIPDLTTPQAFTDTQLTSLLVETDDDVFLATALALEILATDLSLLPAVRTDDLSVSSKDSATLLFKRAQDMRNRSASAVTDDFEIVYPFEQRDYTPGLDWPWV